MKSDLNNKRRTARKEVYKESWEDSAEDESIQDLERKRVTKGKTRKKKASSYEDEDSEFDPKTDSDFEMVEKEDAKEENESLSMQIDEISLQENNAKAKKPKKAKTPVKPKKKVAAKENESNNNEDETNSQVNDDGEFSVESKKAKKNREKAKRGAKNKEKQANSDNNANENNNKEKKAAGKGSMKNNCKKESKDGDNGEAKDAEEASEKGKKKEKKEKKEKVPKDALDLTYDIEKNYFYQELLKEELSKMNDYFEGYFVNGKSFDANKEEFEVKAFLDAYPNLGKGVGNVEKLKKLIEGIFTKIQNNISIISFEKYRLVMNLLTTEYYTYKPTVLEAYFFPNTANEIHVVNMIRTCKETLDIAIFTLTNDKICNAILEADSRKVKVRVIADDECCKMWGSDVLRIAAAGVSVKTDNQARFHMHHKFAVLDKSLVITGSFNWTSQAVKFNQENIIFYENKELAKKYCDAYDSLWNEFTTVITAQGAKEKIEEQLKYKQEKMVQKRLEKEKIKAENNK